MQSKKSMTKYYGIDLGMTNATIAFVDDAIYAPTYVENQEHLVPKCWIKNMYQKYQALITQY